MPKSPPKNGAVFLRCPDQIRNFVCSLLLKIRIQYDYQITGGRQYGTMLLIGISDTAAKAADVYPSVIQLLNNAGVPPDERGKVLSYIIQVIDLDDVPDQKLLS